MKYAKKLDEILSRYLRLRCISYRKWKKIKKPIESSHHVKDSKKDLVSNR